MEKTALGDITVLDLTRVLAGPFCTVLLAVYGANVIKIEAPGKGDDTRGMEPIYNDVSMYFANMNHDKKGITLNLKSPEGKQIFLDLVKQADVVVENYRPGVMDRLGLGYDVLKEVNDRIIYAAVSGFGSYGPDFRKPGYDIIAQAAGGLISITGPENGDPVRAGTATGDVLGGMNLTIGILMALHARELTNKGQRVDVSLVDSVVAALETATQRYFVSGEDPKPMGCRYAAAAPYGSFRAKDGLFVIGAGNDRLFTSLCKVMGREELIEDPRFRTNLDRCANHAELTPEIEKWSCTQSVKEVVEKIDAAGVPCSPINTISMLTKDEHIAKAREMFVPIYHPVAGDTMVNGCPVKLLDTKPVIKNPAPTLGQHNIEVYGKMLGYDEAYLAELTKKGVL